ncbi:MAG: hypothetical protein IJ308_06760 [Clostridia bacterium]|nr:hypothetical protein [Clostridia bacterium]
MKMKWLTVFLSAVCAFACAAFGACTNGSDSGLNIGDESNPDSDSPDIYGPMSEITYETTEYLADVGGRCNLDYEKAGETVTIVTYILMDVDLWVYANGERVEQVPYDAYYWAYAFTMPDEPVHITFEVKSLEDVEYDITYETTEYLMGDYPTLAKGGEWVHITTHVILDADLWVYVNGERVEAAPTDSTFWEYNFIMPHKTAYITFEVVSPSYLTEFEPWLAEISAEDIAEIKESNEIAGIAPGHLITHYTVTDGESISQLLRRYQSLGMRLCKDDCYVTGGLSRTVTITLKGEVTQTMNFYQGLYMPTSFSSLTHYHVENMPSVAECTNAATSYSFITISGNCDIFELDYENGGEAHQVGEGNFLADLEFAEYHGAVPENLPPYYILGEYFEQEYKIYVQDNSLFFMWSGNGYGDSQVTYYQVLNGMDLFALIRQSLWVDGGESV